MRTNSLEALLLLATFFVTHEKFDKALTLLKALREISPEDHRVLRILCYCLVMEKCHAEALDVIETLAAANDAPDGEDLLCLLRLKASSLWGLGDENGARAVLEQSQELIFTGNKTN